MVRDELCGYLSVDCVIFGYSDKELNILVVERTLKDDKDDSVIFSDLTLTGNHVYENETVDEAAYRILFDLTGLENVFLEQFMVFADPGRISKENDRKWLLHDNRNPDKRIVSIGFFALLATREVTLEWKGRNVMWKPLSEVGELAFDHNKILNQALNTLRYKIKNEPIGFELLPQKFTMTEMQHLYEVILGYELDKRNFRKKMAKMKYLIPLDEKQKGVAHKPARLYVFSREVYEKTKKEIFDFTV